MSNLPRKLLRIAPEFPQSSEFIDYEVSGPCA